MKRVYAAAVLTVMAGFLVSTLITVSETVVRDLSLENGEIMQLVRDRDCTGDRQQDQDRQRDGSCLKVLEPAGGEPLVMNGAGTGDQDGDPDQDRDRKRDQSC